MQKTARWGRDLYRRFFGLDFNEILTTVDPIAFSFEPRADLYFANGFANGRNIDWNDFAHGNVFCQIESCKESEETGP